MMETIREDGHSNDELALPITKGKTKSNVALSRLCGHLWDFVVVILSV